MAGGHEGSGRDQHIDLWWSTRSKQLIRMTRVCFSSTTTTDCVKALRRCIRKSFTITPLGRVTFALLALRLIARITQYCAWGPWMDIWL